MNMTRLQHFGISENSLSYSRALSRNMKALPGVFGKISADRPNKRNFALSPGGTITTPRSDKAGDQRQLH
jgi:hypothetical protein